jgi:hypothetical protein
MEGVEMIALTFFQWTKQKPVLDRECILLTLTYYDGWNLQSFEIREVADMCSENIGFYYGIHELDGEEWGDYDELEAEYYCILDYPERGEK